MAGRDVGARDGAGPAPIGGAAEAAPPGAPAKAAGSGAAIAGASTAAAAGTGASALGAGAVVPDGTANATSVNWRCAGGADPGSASIGTVRRVSIQISAAHSMTAPATSIRRPAPPSGRVRHSCADSSGGGALCCRRNAGEGDPAALRPRIARRRGKAEPPGPLRLGHTAGCAGSARGSGAPPARTGADDLRRSSWASYVARA
ncbi:MAG: hypothetical protein NVV68_15310 [Dokdonella sp.]|nr:hypothetical protein [Dokdonella sp.]